MIQWLDLLLINHATERCLLDMYFKYTYIIKNVLHHLSAKIAIIRYCWQTYLMECIYRKISNTWRTKSQNLNDSRLVLQLSLLNLLKPGVK